MLLDRKMFLMTGTSVCSVLTDGFVANILSPIFVASIKPILREDNEDALELAVPWVIKVAVEPARATLAMIMGMYLSFRSW